MNKIFTYDDLFEGLIVVDKTYSSVIFMIDDFNRNDKQQINTIIGRYSYFASHQKSEIDLNDFLKRFKNIDIRNDIAYNIWSGKKLDGSFLKEKIFHEYVNKSYSHKDIFNMTDRETMNFIANLSIEEAYLVAIYKKNKNWIKYVDKIYQSSMF